MNFKLETILYEPERKISIFDKYDLDDNNYEMKDTDKYGRGIGDQYYRATKTEGQFRFEAADERVQITVIDGSGATHSQFFKDGNPRNLSISDDEDVAFQMKGLLSNDLKVTLHFKILHFAENKSQ